MVGLTFKCPVCHKDELDQEAMHPHEIYCKNCGWSCEPHEIGVREDGIYQVL